MSENYVIHWLSTRKDLTKEEIILFDDFSLRVKTYFDECSIHIDHLHGIFFICCQSSSFIARATYFSKEKCFKIINGEKVKFIYNPMTIILYMDQIKDEYF